MNRQPNMRHLHLGCGESLSQLLPVQPAAKPAVTTAKPPVMRVVHKAKKGGGH
jgi:hypothetical protein